MEVDWENFNFIAGKIDDGIWQIPPEDQKYYDEIKKKVEDAVPLDEAYDYFTKEMTMELLDYVIENHYDEIRERVAEIELSNRGN
jgi:hypothetical protein